MKGVLGLLTGGLLAAACGSTASAIAPPGLISPTPWPAASASPFDCTNLPREKCDIERRIESERRQAQDSWRAQVARTYVPSQGVPFVASTPRPTAAPPTPTPDPAVRRCSADDLLGVVNGSNGAGGTALRPVVLANRSGTPCGLKGRPGVRLLIDGRLADASYVEADPNAGELVVLAPGMGPPRTAPSPRPGQAWTSIAFSRSCTFHWRAEGTLRLLLPDGSALEIEMPALQPAAGPAATPVPSDGCLDSPYLPSIRAWNFAAAVAPVTASRAFPALAASANAPGFAIAGETYRFQVVLTNVTDQAIRFAECPNYRMSIGDSSGQFVQEQHELNCHRLLELPSRTSATFEMRITVPPDWAITRDGGLSWVLDDYGAGLKLPLAIARRA